MVNRCLGQSRYRIGERVGMQFQIDNECGQRWVMNFVYDINRPAILKRNLVGLGVDGNW